MIRTLILILIAAGTIQAGTLQDILNTLTNQGETVEIYAQTLETPSNITWVVIHRAKPNSKWETFSLIKTIGGADGVVDDQNLINTISKYVNQPVAALLVPQMVQNIVEEAGGKEKFQSYVNAFPEKFASQTQLAKSAFQSQGIIFQ